MLVAISKNNTVNFQIHCNPVFNFAAKFGRRFSVQRNKNLSPIEAGFLLLA
jgi:hypothetical protein